MIDAYAAAGVDTGQADRGVRALVDVLRTIDIGRPSRSVVGGGHYAAVIEIAIAGPSGQLVDTLVHRCFVAQAID